jgi:F-box/leucine-rich repeat protein 10/11
MGADVSQSLRFCKPCTEQDPSRVMTMKPPPRKSGRKKADPPVVDAHMADATHSVEATTVPITATSTVSPAAPSATATTLDTPNGTLEVNKWIAIAESKTYAPDTFKRLNGSDIGLEWILRDENAMKEPIVVEDSEGLGMKMPSKDLTVRDIANEVGPETHLEVIGMYRGWVELMSSPILFCRCSFAVQFPRVDAWKMGRLLPRACSRAR